MPNQIDSEWAVGLTEDEYELLVFRLRFSVQEEYELMRKLSRHVADAHKHHVFGQEPTATKPVETDPVFDGPEGDEEDAW